MKRNITKLCFWISGVLFIVFLMKTALDYMAYSSSLNSAPFWVWIMMNALYFLLPSVIALICGLVFKRK